MNKPHKHAELIKAWADGAEIQMEYHNEITGNDYWKDQETPTWGVLRNYRIKPRGFDFDAFYPAILGNGRKVVGYFVEDSRNGLCFATRINYIPVGELKWVGEPLNIEWPES